MSYVYYVDVSAGKADAAYYDGVNIKYIDQADTMEELFDKIDEVSRSYPFMHCTVVRHDPDAKEYTRLPIASYKEGTAASIANEAQKAARRQNAYEEAERLLHGLVRLCGSSTRDAAEVLEAAIRDRMQDLV